MNKLDAKWKRALRIDKNINKAQRNKLRCSTITGKEKWKKLIEKIVKNQNKL